MLLVGSPVWLHRDASCSPPTARSHLGQEFHSDVQVCRALVGDTLLLLIELSWLGRHVGI